jgi:hypothetical protein
MRTPPAVDIEFMTGTEYAALENRLRRAADRQGLRLVKSRRRDPRAVDYCRYNLLDPSTRFSVTDVADPLGTGYPLNLHEVAHYLWSSFTMYGGTLSSRISLTTAAAVVDGRPTTGRDASAQRRATERGNQRSKMRSLTRVGLGIGTPAYAEWAKCLQAQSADGY